MTEHSSQFDWLDELSNDPRQMLNDSAADLALEVRVLLDHALRARPDISQQDLAKLLGVTAGRVSQVINGDGNLHVATLARYMRALGYDIRLTPESVDNVAPPLQRETRKPRSLHIYKTTFADTNGVYDSYHAIQSSSETAPVPLEMAQPVQRRKIVAPKRSYVASRQPIREQNVVTEQPKVNLANA